MSKNNSRKSFCFPGSIAECPFCTSGANWGSCSAGKCASPVNEAWRKAVDRWQHSNGKSRHLSLPVVSLRDARSACRLYQPVEFLISWSLRLVKYNTDFRLIHFKRKATWMPCTAANASPYSCNKWMVSTAGLQPPPLQEPLVAVLPAALEHDQLLPNTPSRQQLQVTTKNWQSRAKSCLLPFCPQILTSIKALIY